MTENPMLSEVVGYPVLGHMDNITDICKQHVVDEVVFCLNKQRMEEAMEAYGPVLEDMGITMRMILNAYISRTLRQDLSFFQNEIPMMTFYNKPFDAGQLLIKRCLDIAGSFCRAYNNGADTSVNSTGHKARLKGSTFLRSRENRRVREAIQVLEVSEHVCRCR